ncbi:MAG: hemolysin III family protein [Actinobacteria bacterium]|nr:hemolysin III family protein [Actinomycetota bacterium]
MHPDPEGAHREQAMQGVSPPRARGWIHRVAFLVAGPAGIILLLVAPTWGARVAVAIYMFSVIAVFWVSSTYHRGSWSAEDFARWQRRDHAAIFLLIAGSYTPYCVLALDGAWRLWMLIAIWVGAGVGILVKVYRVDLHVLSGVMYLGLGWAAIIPFAQFARALSPAALLLTVAGGLLYSLGALALALHRPKLFPRTFGYHEVWHAATAAAAACHYVAVLLILIDA